MRDNGPVTQIERPFPRGKTIVSKTDLGGRITEVNDTFLEISGFSADELIGKPHNLIRHPDVPPQVFAHMWDTLRKNRPWRGVVKNRCKNGDHYWVDAYVVPLRSAGRTVGYMSARMEPSVQQIEAAQAQYKAVAAGAPAGGRFRAASLLSVRNGVLAGVLFVIAATLFGAFVGLRGIERSSESVYELQRYNDVATLVSRNNQRAAIVQSDILLALQHAEGAGGADQMDVDEHLKRILESVSKFEESNGRVTENRLVLRSSGAIGGSDTEGAANHAAFERYLRSSQTLIAEGIYPIIDLLNQRQLPQAQKSFVNTVAPLAAAMNEATEAVTGGLFDAALRQRRAVDSLYDRTFALVLSWLAVTVLVVALSSVVFFRGTIRPLRRAIEQMEHIAEGRLSERVDVEGFAEPGQVIDAVATMQVQLKVMLDEIQHASTNIGEQVRHLNATVVAVVNSTEEQYQQATQINVSLQDSGADTQRLAQAAGEAYALARRLSESGAPVSASEWEELVRLSHEAATLAGLNSLAAQEIERLSSRIMSLAAENRENANDAWTVGMRLDETSGRLRGMLEKFD